MPTIGTQIAHTGGIAGNASVTRQVNSSVFQGVAKYHTGGIAGNEVPAILKRGEGVFTEGQMKAMGGSNVQIIDQRSNSDSQTISTQKSFGPDGKEIIQVMVRDEVRQGVGSGAFDQTFRGNMGLRRQPVRR